MEGGSVRAGSVLRERGRERAEAAVRPGGGRRDRAEATPGGRAGGPGLWGFPQPRPGSGLRAPRGPRVPVRAGGQRPVQHLARV